MASYLKDLNGKGVWSSALIHTSFITNLSSVGILRLCISLLRDNEHRIINFDSVNIRDNGSTFGNIGPQTEISVAFRHNRAIIDLILNIWKTESIDAIGPLTPIIHKFSTETFAKKYAKYNFGESIVDEHIQAMSEILLKIV